ncbi:hypothetical protein [Paenibacillus catalpae]|uniref:hypothetical protein n=1 Tax=Paenibacillus catalpae TaxID=1045775 RepID=UPI000B89540E|nr:hypothetical protein [Paenibacillus catalpae]
MSGYDKVSLILGDVIHKINVTFTGENSFVIVRSAYEAKIALKWPDLAYQQIRNSLVDAYEARIALKWPDLAYQQIRNSLVDAYEARIALNWPDLSPSTNPQFFLGGLTNEKQKHHDKIDRLAEQYHAGSYPIVGMQQQQ